MRGDSPFWKAISGAVIGLGLAVSGIPGCFAELLPPPTFRFTCHADSDCKGKERCLDGLCQLPCTQATFNDDCPPGVGYQVCFNGACSHLCEVDVVACPSPQECISFEVDLGGIGGGFGPEIEGDFGICGSLCDASSCPENEICLEGFCVASCDDDGDCVSGLSCVAGVCIPFEDPGTGTGSTGTDSTGTSGTSGTTSTSTGGTGP